MRRSPITPLSATAAAALLTSLAALSACTEDAPEQEPPAEEAKVDLVALLDENDRLAKELYEIEPEITRVCLENQGFSVHDEAALFQVMVIGVDEAGPQEDYYGFQNWLPETATAAEWGFGQWIWESGDEELITAYNEIQFPDEPEIEEEQPPDNSAFEALDAEEQIDWYTAFMGEEKMAYEDRAWRLRNPDATEEELAERRSEIEPAEDEGSIEGEMEIIPPKPGGCELATIEALYGEPQLVEEEMEEGVEPGLAIYTWKYRLEEPAVPPTDQAFIDAETRDVTDAFLTCITERGFGGWEFQDGSWLPVNQYFGKIYQGEDYEPFDGPGYDEPTAMPEPPADLPDDFEGKKAHELDMAVAFAECADEVEYREAFIAASDADEQAAYAAIETDLYTYQDNLREALKTAQDLLQA
ncbi:hypothetical protein [Glycomyces algeriensis]|uniref:Uncharacterized protein n=1 Tax=Glycomyces algeriensis TaxID=256037 RepID=A0A9W6LI63_9ACTN|nr:hypothetical protein [Glycomyces algeriensis]MDA1367878.1 hypothetical protein [Glycomyces algeriensis]MDR7352025.1 hypothetical protein [Glycomyces algeriensis]GLI44757.1 hypothetical protein GALLR39Z86_46070 [Glycomyces algeriensis]